MIVPLVYITYSLYHRYLFFRVTEQITNKLITEASNDITNIVKYKCGGKMTQLKLVDMSKDNTSKMLDQALSNFVQDFKIVELAPSSSPSLHEQKSIQKDPPLKVLKPKKKPGPAMQKRETMRRARSKNGILLSSLKKKIYHCNCIDCQAKRVAEGKPAYLGTAVPQLT